MTIIIDTHALAIDTQPHDWPGALAPSAKNRPDPSASGCTVPRAAYDILRLDPRQTIVREQEPARHVFEILEGAVLLTVTLPDGRRQIVEILEAGDLIGIPLTPSYAASAGTVCATRLRRYDRANLSTLEARIRADIDRRFLKLQEMVVMLGCKSAAERVATFLLGLTGHRRRVRKAARHGEIEVAFELGQSEIASHLGLTIETVCREFTRLKRQGVIESRGRTRLAILDPAALAACAEENRPPRPAAPRDRRAKSSRDEPGRVESGRAQSDRTQSDRTQSDRTKSPPALVAAE